MTVVYIPPLLNCHINVSAYRIYDFILVLSLQHIICVYSCQLSSLWPLWPSLFNLLSISGLPYSMHGPPYWFLWSSLCSTLFTYGLPYGPCGPPCLIYCVLVVFPIACKVIPMNPCGLPCDPCGPSYSIYYPSVVFSIQSTYRTCQHGLNSDPIMYITQDLIKS